MRHSMRHEMALCLGLEDDQGNGVTINISNVAPEDTPDDSAAPIAEASAETDGEEEKVEQLDDSAATLESILLNLNEAVGRGGMTPGEAKLMQCGFDSAMRPLGGSSQKMLPSVESFGGTSDMLSTTQVSLETVKETLTKIWLAIKNAILKAFNFVMNFFAKLFGGMKKIKERATALIGKLGELNGKQATGKISSMAASKLTLGGQFSDITVNNGLVRLKAGGAFIMGPYIKSLEAYYGALASLQGKAGLGGVELKGIDDAALVVFKHAETNLIAAPGDLNKEIIGGFAFTAGKGSTTTDPAEPIGFAKSKDAKSGDEHQEVEPLTIGPLKSALQRIVDVATLFEGQKSTLDGIKTKRDEAITKLDENSKKADTGAVNRFFVRWGMKGASKPWLRPINAYGHFSFVVLRSALSVCERSIAAYK